MPRSSTITLMANLALLTISPTGRAPPTPPPSPPYPSPAQPRSCAHTCPPPFNTEAYTNCPVIHMLKSVHQKTLAYVSVQEETFAVRRVHFNKQRAGAGVGSVAASSRRFQRYYLTKKNWKTAFIWSYFFLLTWVSSLFSFIAFLGKMWIELVH